MPEHDPLRLKILTVAPKSWADKKISKELNCNWQFAKKAKDLRDSKGNLAETTARSGKPLPKSTVQEIIEFCNSDENGRIMPGMKDVVYVKTENRRCSVQKRLLLLDLRDLFVKFKDNCPEYSVSFSKAQLRPKHYLLSGSSGTYSVCVSTIHQNCKLLLDSIDINKNLLKILNR